MIIVSGLPRSGTSLMMGMLEAGGIEVFTDGVRQPDEHNPKGYREVDEIGKKLAADHNYLNRAGNHTCVKILSPFLRHLGGSHRVIYMERDMDEIAASMQKMSGQPVTGAQRAALERHVEATKQYLHDRDEMHVSGCSSSAPSSLATIYINYNQLVTEPGPEIEKLGFFIPELDMTRALGAIDKRLYRNRNPCHQ